MSLRSVLLAAGFGGGFTDVGYSMTADEVAYWSDMAALLDPAAYVVYVGTSQTHTVGTGERDYVVSAWYAASSGSGSNWFHRYLDIFNTLPLADGESVSTDSSNAGSILYICQPSLVTGSDARYTDDPRALFFERMIRIGSLTHYQIGATNTGSGQSTVAFANDFTNGLLLHTSSHDIAWTILLHSSNSTGLNTHDEISDSSRIRFASRSLVPFVRATFPNIKIQGASESEGRGVVTYVKLPGDW